MRSLCWRSWPLLRSPFRGAAALLFLALVGWTLQSWLRSVPFTVIALLLVWAQVAGFFLPTRYSLSEKGVVVKGLVTRRERSWSEFRSFTVDREGLLLSPFPRPSRLARFRGVALQFHGNRDEVVSFVKAMMGRRGGSHEHVGDERQAGGGAPSS